MSMSGPLATRVALVPSAESAAAARHTLHNLLASVGVSGELGETAVLLANELVINAVEHTGGAAGLHAVVSPEAIRLEVLDSSPELPEPNPSPTLLDERGRGLLLVSALASRWGTDPIPDGKIVWCELDRRH
jgi:anti-sigma regulatory factor (Ser/Thr protein kinase)